MTTTTTTLVCGYCKDQIVIDETTGLLIGHDDPAGETCDGTGSIPVPAGVDLAMLAWHLAYAFTTTNDEHHLNLGMDEIRAALPAFLAEIAAARADGA